MQRTKCKSVLLSSLFKSFNCERKFLEIVNLELISVDAWNDENKFDKKVLVLLVEFSLGDNVPPAVNKLMQSTFNGSAFDNKKN